MSFSSQKRTAAFHSSREMQWPVGLCGETSSRIFAFSGAASKLSVSRTKRNFADLPAADLSLRECAALEAISRFSFKKYGAHSRCSSCASVSKSGYPGIGVKMTSPGSQKVLNKTEYASLVLAVKRICPAVKFPPRSR